MFESFEIFGISIDQWRIWMKTCCNVLGDGFAESYTMSVMEPSVA